MIGIIADDLTGAAELAGVAWRFGYTAEVLTQPPTASDAEVVAIDTDSRHCEPAEATLRASAAARHLRRLGADWIYKKVDSVLRGAVLVEVEAIRQALDLQRALLVPANPGLGRIIRNGLYFIGETPVHQTDFCKDPQHPRTSSRVSEMLGVLGATPVAVCRPEVALPMGRIVVGEAETAEDLQAWAKKLDQSFLPAGAAEFFAAVLQPKKDAGRRLKAGYPVSGNALFVCGSMSSSTQQFVSESPQHGRPVLTMPAGLPEDNGGAGELVQRWARDVISVLERHGQAVVTIGRPSVKDEKGDLAAALVAMAEQVVSKARLAQLNVEGGATAAQLMRALAWTHLQVLREVTPGVVTLRPVENPATAVTIKPGSYKWPTALCR